jgi:hypothetical protein
MRRPWHIVRRKAILDLIIHEPDALPVPVRGPICHLRIHDEEAEFSECTRR